MSLPNLPIELIIRICQFLSANELATFIRLSSSCQEIAKPILYRNIEIHYQHKAISCLKALLQQSGPGSGSEDTLGFVKSLSLRLGYAAQQKSFTDLLVTCLGRMPNLEEFIFDTKNGTFAPRILKALSVSRITLRRLSIVFDDYTSTRDSWDFDGLDRLPVDDPQEFPEFPELREVSLDTDHNPPYPPMLEQYLQTLIYNHSKQLERIELVGYTSHRFLKTTTSSADDGYTTFTFPKVEYLHIPPQATISPSILEQFPNITSLSISTLSNRSYESGLIPPNVATKIKSLSASSSLIRSTKVLEARRRDGLEEVRLDGAVFNWVPPNMKMEMNMEPPKWEDTLEVLEMLGTETTTERKEKEGGGVKKLSLLVKSLEAADWVPIIPHLETLESLTICLSEDLYSHKLALFGELVLSKLPNLQILLFSDSHRFRYHNDPSFSRFQNAGNPGLQELVLDGWEEKGYMPNLLRRVSFTSLFAWNREDKDGKRIWVSEPPPRDPYMFALQ
ncbi:hypothetical protein ABKN59_006489 [Abortiporus biennis]